MDIPIQNVYYLLCYAWDKLAEREVVDVNELDSTSLVDLFSRVLINGTKHLLKRGFDRGYFPHHETTTRLQGRICFQDAIRNNSFSTGKLPCDYDELSYNVIHNRILRSTLYRLTKVEGISGENAESLALLSHRLEEVELIDLNNRVFTQVQLHRNNQFYDFLLKVCELIHNNLLVDEQSCHSKFMSFVQDKRQMAIVFENFVRGFYRTHTSYKVAREDIHWRWLAADQVAANLLPKMQTSSSEASGFPPVARNLATVASTPEIAAIRTREGRRDPPQTGRT